MSPRVPHRKVVDTGHDRAQSGRVRVERMVQALLRANAHEGGTVVAEALREGMMPVQALDELLAPAMHEVGRRWELGQIGVAQEHLACAAAGRVLTGLTPALGTRPAGSGPRVLLAGAQGERHDLGLRMARGVLEGAGYTVDYAGADLPGGALVAAAETREPALVGISSIGAWEPAAARDSVRRLLAGDPAVGLLLGGPGWEGYEPPDPARVERVGRLADLLPAAERLTRARVG
jgi:MerR family transcriptional regulator, light-induced transcriptional regulator